MQTHNDALRAAGLINNRGKVMRTAISTALTRLLLLELAALVWFASQAYSSRDVYSLQDFLTTVGHSYREFALLHVIFLLEAIHRFGVAIFGPIVRYANAWDDSPAPDNTWLHEPSRSSTTDSGWVNPSTGLPMVGSVDTSGHKWGE